MQQGTPEEASALDELLAGGSPSRAPKPTSSASSASSASAGSTGTAASRAGLPRLEDLEALVVRAEWAKVLERLGSFEDAAGLPPRLALIYAVALKESQDGGDDTNINLLGIRAVAGLLGMAPDSPLALNLGKRLLRRNPVGLRQRKAPAAPIRIVIVVVALLGGSAVGWLVGPGGDMFWEIVEMMMR